MKFSGQSVSGHGNLYLEGLYGATISFELKSDKEGVDLLGSLDLTNDRAGTQSSSYKLALHVIGDKAEGLLQIQDNTYALKAEKETPEKGAARYTASLVGMNRQNKVFAMYDLEASFDPDNKSVGISLYETRNAGTSSESRERVAGLDLYKGILGWEAELKLPFEDLSVNLSRGDRYCRLRLEYTSATESRSWYLDTWLYYSPGEYLIKAETNLFDLYNDNERNIYTVSLAARKPDIIAVAEVEHNSASHSEEKRGNFALQKRNCQSRGQKKKRLAPENLGKKPRRGLQNKEQKQLKRVRRVTKSRIAPFHHSAPLSLTSPLFLKSVRTTTSVTFLMSS